MENIKTVTQKEGPIRIGFYPRDWKFHQHKQLQKIGNRSFVTDFTGNLVEVFSIGNWGRGNKTEIQSPSYTLIKNTDYVFSFWINGGENDRYQEVCELDIIFNGDWDNRYTYKLNRDFIKYKMHCKGWYLYEIPFTTGENEYTMLQFVSQDAPCAIMPAQDMSHYGNLMPDEPNKTAPQRSNLVYHEGYPRDATWSWKIFGTESAYTNRNNSHNNNWNKNWNWNGDGDIAEMVNDLVDDRMDEINDIMEDKTNEIMDHVKDAVESAISKAEDALRSAGMDSLADKMMATVQANMKNHN
ncbi:MAG: hypothetical protein FWC78_03720 [Defluviitaleaceae bacterium]|nr:hypothetical protein [Defluviitaleaceae bacterium]